MFVHLTKVMVVTLRACEVSAASLFATILSQSFTSGFLQANVVVLQIHLFFHIFTFVATFMIDFFDDAFYIRFVGQMSYSEPLHRGGLSYFWFCFLDISISPTCKVNQKNIQFEAEYNIVNI